jgi:hypothetical protein
VIVHKLVTKYQAELERVFGGSYRRILRDKLMSGDEQVQAAEHAKSMCVDMFSMIADLEKMSDAIPPRSLTNWSSEELERRYMFDVKQMRLMRWLGFLQSTMWQLGYYTVEQLMEDNRCLTVA